MRLVGYWKEIYYDARSHEAKGYKMSVGSGPVEWHIFVLWMKQVSYWLLIFIMTVKHNNAFFINLLLYKLQDVLILTTCFGHHMTIIRSTRAIYHVHVLIKQWYFTVERNRIPLCFYIVRIRSLYPVDC